MDMKKIFALALAALAALVSCQKESNSPEPQPQAQPKIVFELTANYSGDAPATKAIKTGWDQAPADALRRYRLDYRGDERGYGRRHRPFQWQ